MSNLPFVTLYSNILEQHLYPRIFDAPFPDKGSNSLSDVNHSNRTIRFYRRLVADSSISKLKLFCRVHVEYLHFLIAS